MNDPKRGEYRYTPIVPPGSASAQSERYLSTEERIVIADGILAGRSKRSGAGGGAPASHYQRLLHG